MSLFQVMWFLFLVAGAAVGGQFGYSHFGAWGAVLGVPIGGGIGFLAALAIGLLMAIILQCLPGVAASGPLASGHKDNSANKAEGSGP